MAEVPEYSQAGDVFRKAMEESMAHLDEVNATLRKEQDKAIDLQIAAKEEFNRIQREAHQISEAYIEKHRKEYLARIQSEVFHDVLKKLILAEIPSNRLKEWLEVPPQILADVWFEIGFEKLGEFHIAHVAYKGTDRIETVVFYRNDLTLLFPYKFSGELKMATIKIPTTENWERETGIAPDDRQIILEFVAHRVVRDLSPNGKYVIQQDRIEIK